MNAFPLLPAGQGLTLVSSHVADGRLMLQIVATARCSPCPLCAQPAKRIHRHSTRVVTDLPCAGHPVQLLMRVRKFFCDTLACPRKIFTERLNSFLAPWARMTRRLCEAIQAIGLATCGKLGARLAARLGISSSWMTVLRQIMALPLPPRPCVSHLGVDDFSFRRGRTFGTILVDLHRRQVIDLLPDRQAETAAAWMLQHPEIDLVSRDRGGDSAAAARQGAPQAIQVADRFHVMKNLTEAVGLALGRCVGEWQHAHRCQSATAAAAPDQMPLPALDEWRPRRSSTAERAHRARQAEREAAYQHMRTWQALGLRATEIAERLGKSPQTVRNWLARGTIPQATRQRKLHSHFDSYAPYVLARWQEGCHNGLQLWREITARGYRDSPRMLYRFLATLPGRIETRAGTLAQAKERTLLSVRDAVWLVVRDPTMLEADEQEELTLLCQASSTARQLYALVQEFRRLLHQKAGHQLDAWLEQASASQIKELQSFVLGVEKDKVAVVAGFSRPENNGPTEGHVTKLKLVKRAMYGRASFSLLRQRLLHPI